MAPKRRETVVRRQRRSIDQQIADLAAQIVAIQERESRKADPALRHAAAALKAVDAALAAAADDRVRAACNEARAALATVVGENAGAAPARTATRADPDELLAFVRDNPGRRGEQIASALGTDAGTIRPVMKRLIAAGKVSTAGQKRGMTYAAV